MREAFMSPQKVISTHPKDMTLSENTYPAHSGAWRRR